MAIGARFYCPVHSFIAVIEMRALSPAHSSVLWSNCVLQRADASWRDDDLMMAPKMLQLRYSSKMREVNTRRRRKLGLAQAERLREGYRYSLPSGAQPPGIKFENLARVTPGCVRGADRQTDGSALNDTVAVATTSDS